MLVVFRDFGLSVAAFPFGFGGHLLLDWRLGMGSTFLYHNIIVSRKGGGIELTRP
jgi:hypothetical protein